MRIAVVAALLAMTSIAAAQAPGQTMSWAPDPATPSAPPVETVTVSYRSQIIIADLASVGLLALGPLVSSNEPDLSGIGFTGLFLAAPIVHAAHGRVGTAAKSFGLRVALPIVAGVAGYKLGPNDITCDQAIGVDGRVPHDSCERGSVVGALIGAVGGLAGAMYIDAKYLARYQDQRPVMWSAGIAPVRGGASLSFSGSF